MQQINTNQPISSLIMSNQYLAYSLWETGEIQILQHVNDAKKEKKEQNEQNEHNEMTSSKTTEKIDDVYSSLSYVAMDCQAMSDSVPFESRVSQESSNSLSLGPAAHTTHPSLSPYFLLLPSRNPRRGSDQSWTTRLGLRSGSQRIIGYYHTFENENASALCVSCLVSGARGVGLADLVSR